MSWSIPNFPRIYWTGRGCPFSAVGVGNWLSLWSWRRKILIERLSYVLGFVTNLRFWNIRIFTPGWISWDQTESTKRWLWCLNTLGCYFQGRDLPRGEIMSDKQCNRMNAEILICQYKLTFQRNILGFQGGRFRLLPGSSLVNCPLWNTADYFEIDWPGAPFWNTPLCLWHGPRRGCLLSCYGLWPLAFDTLLLWRRRLCSYCSHSEKIVQSSTVQTCGSTKFWFGVRINLATHCPKYSAKKTNDMGLHRLGFSEIQDCRSSDGRMTGLNWMVVMNRSVF